MSHLSDDPSELIAHLVSMVIALNLHHGIENSLDAKLAAVERAWEDEFENNDQAVCTSLDAFIQAVNAQYGTKIDASGADELIGFAQQIIELLCP